MSDFHYKQPYLYLISIFLTILSQYETEFLEFQENEQPSVQPEESDKENLRNKKRENIKTNPAKRKQVDAKTEKAIKKKKE